MSVRRSLAWSYGGQAFTFVVTFASSVVLARLLGPREMGVFAMAAAAAAILSTPASFGVGAYLIREAELTRDLVRSAYTVNTIMNLLASLLIFGMGVSAALAFGEREIGAVLVVTSVGPLIGAFEFVPNALHQREMGHGFLARLNMARTVVVAVTVVGCAHAGWGPLSPAMGPVAAGLFSATYLNIRRRRDIVVKPTRRGLKPIFVHGLQMLSIGGVAQIAGSLSGVVIGRMLGLTALGLYNRAASLAGMVWGNVYGLATSVVFAKLSRDLRDKGALHETFLRSMRLITALVWPLVIGIAVLARPMVHLLYGDEWMGAATPLALLMVGQFVALGFGMNWELFILRHETARQTRYEFIRAVVGLAAVVAGSCFSIAAAAAGRLVETAVGYLLYRPHIDRLAGIERGEMEKLFGEGLVLTMVATAPAFALMLWSRWAADTSPPLIGMAVAFGVAGWFAVLVARDHPLVAELELAFAKVRRSLAAPKLGAA